MKIRVWKEEDIEKVRTVFWETWMATYSSYIPESDLQQFLDEHYSRQVLHHMLTKGEVYGFIAEIRDSVAGVMRCTHKRDEGRFYVNSLYVRPAYQHAGVGTRLMGEAARQAIACGCNAIWLGVMQKNIVAYEWYKKIGFRFVEEAPFTMGTTTVNHLIGFKPVEGCEHQDGLSSGIHENRV
ncbi:MAG: Histone acetyltransferase HPA2-like protein [Bacteroidetes bacterium]|nr:Histone acetyltransferase HPA2-like protein [Bacteroidota bacterium]